MQTLEIFSQISKEVSAQDVMGALQSLIDVFNLQSLTILAVLLVMAFVVGRIASILLRALSKFIRKKADNSKDLGIVNTLRRFETWTILSIAIFQAVFFSVAVYLWWLMTHEGGSHSGALIGAGAVAVVLIGSVTRPLLQDMASGASMMAENWFGVGDLITVEFPKAKGVVEMVSMRSTKIRGLNGETIWLSNQSIQGVSVANKGVLSLAIELFVNDVDAIEKLVDDVNNLLPTGNALLAERLKIVGIEQRSNKIWHVTAIGETAPGRDWILSETAIELLKKIDEKRKTPILLADPVSRFADRDSEKQFARAVRNAKKPRRRLNYHRLTSTQIEKAKDGTKVPADSSKSASDTTKK